MYVILLARDKAMNIGNAVRVLGSPRDGLGSGGSRNGSENSMVILKVNWHFESTDGYVRVVKRCVSDHCSAKQYT